MILALFITIFWLFSRVDNQQISDPRLTIKEPFQKDKVNTEAKIRLAKAADKTGIKYEAVASTVTFPLKIPIFQAA